MHLALSRFWNGPRRLPDDRFRMLFEIAVSEVAANIVEHARPPLMFLRLESDSGTLTAQFSDAGLGWEGDLQPADVLDEMTERGRGLALAMTAVDELVYTRIGQRNAWRLVKHLPDS